MHPFFNTVNEIDQFTMELDRHQDNLHCTNCHKSDQFVSHGYVYKKKNKDEKKVVGKRIFCSNRFGKSGCGCTFRFYLAIEIPKLKFNTTHLAAFLRHLFKGLSIEKSYNLATGTAEPRQAYRWLKKLELKRFAYRQVANQCSKGASELCTSANNRIQLIFSSLQPLLFNLAPDDNTSCHAYSNPCKIYQWQQQVPFL